MAISKHKSLHSAASQGSVPTGFGAEAGFTLVETLLALMIAASLFTGMFMTLDQVVRSRDAMSNQATPYIIGPAILDVIQRDLANLYFYDFKENNSFYGADAELLGREADALSFISMSKAYAPDQELPSEDDDGRYSFANEIAYVCRSGPGGSGLMELWRREDFFVDDAPHSDGDYIPLYDRVHSLTFKFISRNPEGGEGIGGTGSKRPEDMLQDGWNAIDEGGVPRAILCILEIYARDGEQEVGERDDEDRTPRIYRFSRYLALPQMHMSRESEQQIANWDGEFNEATAAPVGNQNGQGGAANAARGGAGAGGRNARGGRGRGQQGQGRGRGQGRNGGQQGAGRNGAGNPFLQALQGRGGGARPAGGGGGRGLGGLFGGR